VTDDGPAAHFPAGRWRARWIWAADAPNGRHTVALQRTFTLDSVPASAPARWCAVSRAALSVNGVEVGRGPVRSNPRRQPADDRDLAPYLREGENVLAVLVTCYPHANPWYLPPPMFSSDLVGGAFVFEALLDDVCLVSDESWGGRVLEGWDADAGGGVSGRGRERVSAAPLPHDWTVASAGWPPALLRRAHGHGEPTEGRPPTYPIGPFGGRPISWPDTIERALTRRDDGSWVAPEIVAGTIALDADGPAGSTVVVTAAEFLRDGEPAPSEHDASVAFTLDGGHRTLESFDAYGMHGARVEAGAGVTVHGITVRERLYPVRGAHTFACSDPVLDDIYRVGRRTVTLNSADAYTDCPTREQRAWTGDAVVHQLVDLTTNDDWGLARRHPRLAAVPRPDGMLPMAVAGDAEAADFTIIPDWALHWVHSVWNLYRYVGDREEIASLLQVAEGVVRWFESFCDGDGLPTDVYGWVIIDWASVHSEGVSSSICGLWARALLEVAEMAEWLGDGARAARARAVHARVRAGFEKLWDPERGRYVDSMVGGSRRPMASQHGQSSALVGGLVPAARVARLVEVITDRSRHVHATFAHDGPAPPNSGIGVGGQYLRHPHPEPWWDVDDQVVVAQPFFRYVVHDALVAAGRADLVADQCRDWALALERCSTSWTETWFGGTISHGWSSTPTRDLVQRVLGITPAAPGFAVAAVDPALGSLSWARGSAPTPVGPIVVAVDRTTVTIDSPLPFTHAGVRHEPGHHKIGARP
jgi:alpha-L-rhamnosidase